MWSGFQRERRSTAVVIVNPFAKRLLAILMVRLWFE